MTENVIHPCHAAILTAMSRASLGIRLGARAIPAAAMALSSAIHSGSLASSVDRSQTFSLMELAAAGWLPQLIATDGKYSWLFGVFLAAMASIISNLGLTFQVRQRAENRERSDRLLSCATAILRFFPSSLQFPQKLTHQRIANGYGRPGRPYYLHPLWIIGLLLVMFASLADVIALCFAPQSLIAPLGALTMVSNVVFAPLLLHEKIGVRDLIATAVILSGSIVCVIFGAHEDKIYTISELFGLFADGRFVAYAVCVGVGVTGFFFMLQLFAQQEELAKTSQAEPLSELQRRLQRFGYPAIAGGIGAQSVLFAKCTVELMINTGRHNGNAFSYWQTYFILVCVFGTIFLQIKWLNDGLIRFDTSYIVPVFVSFWIILSVMSGMIFFKEYAGMSWTQIGLFGVGVAFTIGGVVLLSFRPITNTNQSRGTTAFDFDGDEEEAPLQAGTGQSDGSNGQRRHSTEKSVGNGTSSASAVTDKDHMNGTLAQRRAGGVKHANGKTSSRHTSPSLPSRSLGVGLGFSPDAAESIDSSADDPASVSRRQQEEDAADRSDEDNGQEDQRSLLDRGSR